ncbi:MAG: DsbA family protein [Armatimonadota bacterium]|nr:DsbA family protein [Armatimonadota bacterium]
MAEKIAIEYFTDPFCAWSFAAEGAMERFRDEWMGRSTMICRMLPILDRVTGLPGREARVRTADEMAEKWHEIGAVTGVSIDPGVWSEDPPQSTWPACIAVKAAERQGMSACAQFLKALRVNVMQRKRNGSKRNVLADVAGEAGLDTSRFLSDLASQRDQLEREVIEDKHAAEANCITSTPALLMTNAVGDKVLIVGVRDYLLYHQAAEALLSGQRAHESRSARAQSG